MNCALAGGKATQPPRDRLGIRFQVELPSEVAALAAGGENGSCGQTPTLELGMVRFKLGREDPEAAGTRISSPRCLPMDKLSRTPKAVLGPTLLPTSVLHLSRFLPRHQVST